MILHESQVVGKGATSHSLTITLSRLLFFILTNSTSTFPESFADMDFLGASYAAVVAAGGIIGYVKAGRSTVSMVMGLLFGSVSGFGAYQMGQDPKNYGVLLLSSGVLAGVMGYRAINSGKFMPGGLVATLSLLMVLRLAPRLMN
ncbi:hypothetical protein CAPTEDRAFT_172315 [Capitella teleta]|uniref:Transmembrane protein 14C n=1 Tax=Capitella teleta TaxID=283909 RepID=R7UC74_CAPTE|nr:hypothetical protein CAPTEDRAFT_172315 [Capitella teleta]|eukprot:ELU03721.1 hypothetical protein CAPTEDRAFT_172315 [Capitella teleta]